MYANHSNNNTNTCTSDEDVSSSRRRVLLAAMNFGASQHLLQAACSRSMAAGPGIETSTVAQSEQSRLLT
eukprot:9852189-Lingulodinium_polyedra.AAC.1